MTKPVASHENRISVTDVYHVNKDFKKKSGCDVNAAGEIKLSPNHIESI